MSVRLLVHSPPVELEEILALVSACLEYEAEVMNTLCTADLCSELCKFILGTSDMNLTYELAVEVIKSDLYCTAVKKSRSANCE